MEHGTHCQFGPVGGASRAEAYCALADRIADRLSRLSVGALPPAPISLALECERELVSAIVRYLHFACNPCDRTVENAACMVRLETDFHQDDEDWDAFDGSALDMLFFELENGLSWDGRLRAWRENDLGPAPDHPALLRFREYKLHDGSVREAAARRAEKSLSAVADMLPRGARIV